MIDSKVTNYKNIFKKNFPYIITWIFYYAWVIVFTTWWAASPLTDQVFGIESRVLLHSLNLLSSAFFVFLMKRKSFKKYASIGAILVIISSLLFAITKNYSISTPTIHSIVTIILAISLGIVNAGILVPFVYVLNNTEKFYSVVGTNIVICILVLLQELNFLNIGNGLLFSFTMLVVSLMPIFLFKVKDYELEEIKCIKQIPKTTKIVYITLIINCLYAIFCKSVGKAFLIMANAKSPINLNIYFYLGGLLGCIIYYLIYHYLKKCNNATWNITFGTFALAMFIYAIVETIYLKIAFSIFIGIGSTMGMINMYYILGVIGKKYWSQKYVKASVFFIGVCGGASGVLLGKILTNSNNISMSISISILSFLIVLVLLCVSPHLALSYYNESWEEDSTKSVIDNLEERKFKKYKLTPREIQLCKLILQNLTTRQIAATLGITENTVKTYRKGLHKKLNINAKEELYDLFK